MHSRKAPGIMILLLLVTAVGLAQNNTASLDEAKAALGVAEGAGAPTYAKTLYDDAAYRIRFAQENWNGKRAGEAQMRAIEASAAAQAATAKARWLTTNAAMRTLQEDITRFGGTTNVTLVDESPAMEINRGTTTSQRIMTAQAAIDEARSAGAEQLVADANLKLASDILESARKVSSRGRVQSDVGDSLAYRAEMIARRAYYLARLTDAGRRMPDLQLQRTRLAQTASERSAAAERTQRQEAERHAAELQQQLAQQEVNRQAQAAELETLRQQIDAQRAAAQAQRVADRAARSDAERRVDDAFRAYQLAIASPTTTPADIDATRRALEDATISLRAAQERERLAQDAMTAEVTRRRNDLSAAQGSGTLTPQLLSSRQADLISRQQELEQFRQERQDAMTRRAEAERTQSAALDAALRARQEREAQAQALKQAAEMAQQQAAEAQKQMQVAQQATAAAQQEAEAQAKAAAEQAKAAEEAKAAAQQATAATQQVQAELEKTRQELAARDAEARQLRMQNELARIAATRREERGLIVTLSSGVFFDSGKSALKKGAKTTLTRIADQLKSDSGIKVTVEGHTDNTGTAEKNETLSEKRAEAVRDFLVKAGVPADRVNAVGKGDTQPIATNKTAAGRQHNRRVELVITQ